MTSSQKRSFKELQGATIDDDELLQEPWYAINPDEIAMMVEDMCDKLTAPLQKYTNIDSRFQDVIDAVYKKIKLPDIRRFNVAILGEQGTGKSSLINALLDRGLLDRSGSSKACTAYATILEHKKGAPDQTNLSDLTIEFLDEKDIKHIIREQINHWIEFYPDPKTRDPLRIDDERNPNSHDSDTAKEFFETIFDVQNCIETGDWLEKQLHHTNIEEGDFSHECYEEAMSRLARTARDMKEFNPEARAARFINISDNRIWKETTAIKGLWPFVKAVTIATGHLLLRHGLRLFDLPGYGDTSQIREVVINNFRKQVDFEIIVALFSRFQTSILQEHYINRSIHLRGAKKTVLVMNKSDTLTNDDNMRTQINQIKDDPFPLLKRRLEYIDDLASKGCTDADTISTLLNDIQREITIAYIKYETASVQKKMHSKGIRVFSVSALAHTASRDHRQRGKYALEEKTAGILELRTFMAKLPAAINYQNYCDHVYVALAELRNEATRPLDKHLEDKTYAAMRRKLMGEIPFLRLHLEALSGDLTSDRVDKPWSRRGKRDIMGNIRDMIDKRWTYPHIYAQGFAKMLRENGIPMNGQYYGRNLNADLLSTMKDHFDTWYDNMHAETNYLADSVFAPVGNLLALAQWEIENSSAQFALKYKATEELKLISQRIEGIQKTLLASLSGSLAETHLFFTTEIDISCPIAQEMKACYDRALDPQLVGSGTGIYSRQRGVLCASIIKPSDTNHRSLLDRVAERIQKQQRKCWKVDCDVFISSVMNQLNAFLNTMEQLLESPTYKTPVHFQARRELMRLLTEFDVDLRRIQNCFPNKEHIEKKARF